MGGGVISSTTAPTIRSVVVFGVRLDSYLHSKKLVVLWFLFCFKVTAQELLYALILAVLTYPDIYHSAVLLGHFVTERPNVSDGMCPSVRILTEINAAKRLIK